MSGIKTSSDFECELDALEQRLSKTVLHEGEYSVLNRVMSEIDEEYELFSFLSDGEYDYLSARIKQIISTRRMAVY